MKKNLTYGTICLIAAVISSVSTQCCDFNTVPCIWENTGRGRWRQTPQYEPDLTDYPNFFPTQPSAEYTFLQYSPGVLLSKSLFHIESAETVISFDYFIDDSDPKTGHTLVINFERADQSFSTTIANISNSDSSWRSFKATCDSSNSFCCGGEENLPCDGKLIVQAQTALAYPDYLFAIDNIGVC
ncbi:hypothetical protein CHUAL_008373 [Chamberlinius hualienensis]